MRRYPILVTAAAVALLSGCSPSTDEPAAETSAPTTSPAAAPSPSEAGQLPDGAVLVSPGGVTTGVGAPADATESGYGQACLAARAWFDAQNGTVEAYLQTVQAPGAAGPGSFNIPWPELSPGQQAAVIMAANAAANAECG